MMATSAKKWQTPGVVFQPATYKGFQRGINKVVNAISPTLGPLPRIAVIEQASNNRRPELLDDGAVIARRIIQLQNREEDMGAMYIRQMLWELHDTVGDGAATAAVMFRTIYNQGIRYIVAGGDAMHLRIHLENYTRTILDELTRMTIHIQGKDNLTRLAETLCYDPSLAKILGEIFDIIGEYGQLDIRSGRSLELEREYVEGTYWEGGIFSRSMITDLSLGRVQLENASIVISDLEVEEPQDLVPLLDMAIQAGIKALLLLVKNISDSALSILLAKPNRMEMRVVVAKVPDDVNVRKDMLDDLAVLTGGRPLLQIVGDTFRTIQVCDLGESRRAWADPNHFGIVGGKGDPRQLRQHVSLLRSALANADDLKNHKHLQERIGKLIGGTAVLWVGAGTPIRIEERKVLAQRTSEAMRGAMREGVLPGGGTALLACRRVLKAKSLTEDNEEYAANSILLKAIETPTRTLLSNAGIEAGEILGKINRAGPEYGFDVIRRQIVNMTKAGIFDPASVIKAIAFSAIHSAALALTIDVLIHRANPPEAYANP